MSASNHPAEEPAQDVLAAEAFALPAPDPSLHHGPVALPEDPTGIAEPHDVLAAEEFAMPAPRPHPEAGAGTSLARRAQRSWRLGVAAAAGAVLALAALRLLRRR